MNTVIDIFRSSNDRTRVFGARSAGMNPARNFELFWVLHFFSGRLMAGREFLALVMWVRALPGDPIFCPGSSMVERLIPNQPMAVQVRPGVPIHKDGISSAVKWEPSRTVRNVHSLV